MKKKAWLICLMLLLLLTGCGKNAQSSPEALAKAVAKNLSNGEYEKIIEFLNIEENVFIDKDSFISYLDEESLKIEGNEKIEIYKTEKDSEENVSVHVRIDNYKILEINTIKKEDKWYVELDKYDFDSDTTIAVPTGAKVKLNDKELSFGTYGSESDLRASYEYGGKTYYEYFDVDVYKIPKMLKGQYKLKVTHDSIEDIDTTIDLSSYYNSDTTNFYSTYSYDYAIRGRLKNNKTDVIKTVVNNYYNGLIQAINSGNDFSTLEQYFVEENYQAKKDYNTLISKRDTEGDEANGMFTNATLDSLKYNYDYVGLYHSGDETVVFVEYVVKYSKAADSSDEQNATDESKTYRAIIHLTKDDGAYKIKDGTNLIPSI